MQKIGLLSDTHGYIDPSILDFFSECNQIWHTGDIGNIETFDLISAYKPVKAVYGNIDGHEVRSTCPQIQRFNCEGADIIMTHIGGYPGRYDARILPLLQSATPDIFICGHSHILKIIYDKKLGLLHLNPGAAGLSGFHNVRTALRFDIENGKPLNMQILELPRHTKNNNLPNN